MGIAFLLIIGGLFKKAVISDYISVNFVDRVFDNPSLYTGLENLLATYGYAVQIYCDFSGYSDIAIGASKVLGIKLMDNFRTPYLSRNISEFWSRWHISLSTWFRDYLYIPLGGNRVVKWRWYYNLMIVFLVSGFWHGANWTFIMWGAIWGAAYLLEKLISYAVKLPKIRPGSPMHIINALKMFVLATFAWIPFRSDSLEQMGEMLNALVYISPESIGLELETRIFVLIPFFLLSDMVLYNRRIDVWLGERPLALRWGIYGVLMFCVIVFAAVEEFPFIYFQF